jgi:hypothetical protein
MRTLSPDDIIQLVDTADVAEVESRMPMLDDDSAYASGWILRGLKEGFFRASRVMISGEHVATVAWSLACDPERVLNVNAICSFAPGIIDNEIEASLLMLAHGQGCKIIEYHTRRKGLLRASMKYGYKLHSIVCRKYI